MLPTRDGVGPSCVTLPAGSWPCLIDFLVFRFPAVSKQEWAERMARGHVVNSDGNCVAPKHAYRPRSKLYYYRHLAHEAPIAGEERVLFEDEFLVAADKPHFLPVMPSGNYLQETLLVRLRRKLGVAALTPIHRIDRETAGVVLFSKQAASRTLYHALFADRAVHKVYQAIAPLPPLHLELRFPLTHASELADSDNFMQVREVLTSVNSPGPLNAQTNARKNAKTPAQTTIEWMETQGALARYRLTPLTGKRHQLRVHMAALGMPILGDQIYPVQLAPGSDNPANPLRLLAQSISFRDPITAAQRSFTSGQTLNFPELASG